MSNFLTSREVRERAGITYRQLEWWIKQGWIPGQGPVGSGVPRRFTHRQMQRVIEIRETFDRVDAILMKHGLGPSCASTRLSKVRRVA